MRSSMRTIITGIDVYKRQVYEALLPYCEEVLVTKVDAEGGAETFFPNLDRKKQFVAVEESEPIEDNGYTIRFMKYRNTEVCEL